MEVYEIGEASILFHLKRGACFDITCQRCMLFYQIYLMICLLPSRL